MGAITGLLGIGNSGAGFQAGSAPIVNPLTAAASQNAAAQTATNLVTNTANQVAPASAQGVANQNQVYQQMQQLAAQLGQQAQGQGPNPALAQLAQTTGQNIAGTTAAMAGVRGANANPGLVARQAAQQGAATQQQAVGQGATLAAQQQLAAQQNLAQQQQNLANLGTTQVGEGLNAASTGANAAQNQAGLVAGQVQGLNTANIQNQASQNSANAGVQSAAQSGGGLGKLLGLADGGVVPSTTSSTGPQSFFGKFMSGVDSQSMTPQAPPTNTNNGLIPTALSAVGAPTSIPGLVGSGVGAVGNALGIGGPSAATLLAAKGGSIDYRKSGGKVPGEAKVKGDSYANDTVDAKLSPKEIVLPRSVTMSSDPVRESAKFVAAVLAKRSRR